MRLFKIITLIILLIISMTVFVNANPTPYVVFKNSTYGTRSIGKIEPNGGTESANYYVHGEFAAWVNHDDSFFRNIEDANITEQQLEQNLYSLRIVTTWDKAEYNVPSPAIYILDSNTSKSIGYVLTEPIAIYSRMSNDVQLNKVRSLPTNPNFLSSKLVIPSGITVTFYEKDHGTYIERYGISKNFNTTEQYEDLILDSFYPKFLEDDFEDIIANDININLQAIKDNNM